MLTTKQSDVLEYCKEYLANNDQMPTVATIAKHFGLKSPTAANAYLIAFEKKGYIERNENNRWRFKRG